MPFTIVSRDITQLNVDAVVNAANSELRMGGGVCGAIFAAAGARQLTTACSELGPVPTGKAAITPGFNLPAKYVIHAVGPVYDAGNAQQCAALLYSAYQQSLRLATENGCDSIAFPLISSSIYGYPKRQAFEIAVAAIRDYLSDNELDVYLALLDKSALDPNAKQTAAAARYLKKHYTSEVQTGYSDAVQETYCLAPSAPSDADYCPDLAPVCQSPTLHRLQQAPRACMPSASLDELVGRLDEPFCSTLFRLIDAKGRSEVEVYKRANLSRKLFSKIRSGNGYMPSKRTIIALALALELSLSETEDLLKRAGYALNHSQMFDVIVEHFIVHKAYDVLTINEVLFQYDQPLLGA